MAAAGVNRADLLQRAGNYPPPAGASQILGLEAAGTIVAVGPGVDNWAPGDRVMALLSGGGYAEKVAVPHGQLLPVPDSLSLVEAAAIPEAFLTSWLALRQRAELASGETVLIHAAASGVGTAAIQIAQALGARVIAASRDTGRLAVARELGAQSLVSSSDGLFATAVTDIAPDGVDVVLDLVGPAWWDENVSCLGAGGRIVMLSLMGGRRHEVDFGRLLPRQATLHTASLRLLSVEAKAALVADFHDRAIEWLSSGTLVPVIDRTLPLHEAATAHALLEDSPITGKLILDVAA